jgi:hypothetical protein
MSINIPLFQKIDQRLEEDESLLEMSTWEDHAGTTCGTTRCVSGWAIHEKTGTPLYAHGQAGARGDHHPAIAELAEELGVEDDFEVIGAKLLGLTPAEASRLFYASNDKAREAVTLYAQNRAREARRLLNL